MRHINQAERAFRAWPILTAVAARKDVISYSGLGRQLGIHHRAIRFVLSLIQDYCLEVGLPPLTILVVNSSGRPGNGFIAYDLNNLNQGNELVWSHAWNTEENPFSFASNGDSYESLLKILTNTPNESEQVYRSVSSRGIKQYLFREALLRAYSNKCAITSFSIPEALEACHIVPWAQASEQQRMDVRNGLLLNSLHHKLFDRGYLTITTDYKIVFRRTEDQKHEFTDLERSLTFELQGREMNIPRLHKHRPCPEYINFHHQLFEWEI